MPELAGQVSLVTLIESASPFAKIILVILAVLLYATIWFIIRKHRALKRLFAADKHFEQDFWAGNDLGDLERKTASGAYGASGLSQVFLAGYGEYNKMRSTEIKTADAVLSNVQRAANIAIQLEIRKLSAHMTFLENVGSSSPYIGLLGTVWGVMNSFRSLSGATQATLAHVAPGIAEALIATAMGLMAAIPAVIAHSHFRAQIEVAVAGFDNFTDALSNILHRNL